MSFELWIGAGWVAALTFYRWRKRSRRADGTILGVPKGWSPVMGRNGHFYLARADTVLPSEVIELDLPMDVTGCLFCDYDWRTKLERCEHCARCVKCCPGHDASAGA